MEHFILKKEMCAIKKRYAHAGTFYMYLLPAYSSKNHWVPLSYLCSRQLDTKPLSRGTAFYLSLFTHSLPTPANLKIKGVSRRRNVWHKAPASW